MVGSEPPEDIASARARAYVRVATARLLVVLRASAASDRTSVGSHRSFTVCGAGGATAPAAAGGGAPIEAPSCARKACGCVGGARGKVMGRVRVAGASWRQ